ncbi:MAG: tRNA preQ1(34) S-adenosylmethionine ribosyltransferase-isomerase QueA [Armatimonadetes bacterium]|nr:tRNA preQ1(34) S-adenosylmethionine ribosyltransferase-isomerase QueA [Armatimonadota bacterium]
MDVSLFDYHLPPESIAQEPLPERSASRMLVLARTGSEPPSDRAFRDLPEFLRPGDLLVLNDTRVIPARLIGRRSSGGRVEALLLRPLEPDLWEALVRPAARMRPGQTAEFGDGRLNARVVEALPGGLRVLRLSCDEPLEDILDQVGQTPLPPYIKRAEPRPEDRARYQTVYAAQPGAVAAPTAGLHFDAPTLAAVESAGAAIAHVTLHVGLGTFQPVSVDTVEEHEIHSEWCSIPDQTAEAVNATRAQGGRVIAVGTTVVRALESWASSGRVSPGKGLTNLFIYPGYQFQIIDALLTNFHLPRSSLLMLVSAFAGRERILSAYSHAVQSGYRFYSYGDCMLIL